jgi:hypothetical protein
MDHSDIQLRLRSLQGQITRLRAANEAYLKKRFHQPVDVIAHRRREERLHDILGELKEISSRIKAA